MLTQDTPLEKIKEIIEYMKTRHPVFETPVVLEESESIQTALNLIHKRSHGGIVIVDKDNAPKWNPATAEGVTDALVDAIFAPLPVQEEWKPL